MQLGMIGLGRMGGNMVRRLMRGGHACVVFDLNAQTVKQCERDGATGAASLDDLIQKLTPPRAVWVMLPAGAATDETVTALAERMAADDIILDGGNSHFKDDIRRAKALKPKGLHYVDVGTSGGGVGSRARLLSDNRRGTRTGPAARPDFPHPGPRQGGYSRNTGP